MRAGCFLHSDTVFCACFALSLSMKLFFDYFFVSILLLHSWLVNVSFHKTITGTKLFLFFLFFFLTFPFLLGPGRDKLLYIIHTNHKAEWRQTCYDSPRGLRPPSSSSARAASSLSSSPVASLVDVEAPPPRRRQSALRTSCKQLH